MEKHHDRAVCVMSVGGGKYLEQYRIVERQMQQYAARCNADFVFINDWIDKAEKGIYIHRSSL
ncbi:hypothetical protein BACPEC_02417 [[Bacteroides] pectinophilus ATCC 43243]|uniref:Uncharacterized protein n=1 Tax=[Bacteroides] pectinophilus ATCC 43243 TaxID=483218 RepID=B7AUL9_9FIRM|nr:hypothetical protein BACPEC_02417 [[Bacteroides] pectinophilus ATCC 43243]